MNSTSLIIGVDAGTSFMKAVAFDLKGRQIASASLENAYVLGARGAATQSLEATWSLCARALRALAERTPDLRSRVAAIAVTAQGDGTWLVGADDEPAGDAWLWLDGRAAPAATRLAASSAEAVRFQRTGTGLAACHQSAQLAQMSVDDPDLLARAEVAFHCKDWLYLKLTGVRATDPSEASLAFGNFRTRAYDADVLDAIEIGAQRRLLPEIVDGAARLHALTLEAATQIGLNAGTPVCLAPIDIVCTGLGAGLYAPGAEASCTIIGSTGMHMKAMRADAVELGIERTGYTIVMPVDGAVARIQSNLASTLNIDWILDLAADLSRSAGAPTMRAALVKGLDGWLAETEPGEILYHPYIAEGGERGPFVDPNARASFIGLCASHRFSHLVRAVIEGVAMAAKDCYAAMGGAGPLLRLTGGAARSPGLRAIMAAAVGAAASVSEREEAGAAGAAMVAAVALGLYPTMAACVEDWVAPLLRPAEAPDARLVAVYQRQFEAFRLARLALPPTWRALSRSEGART